MGHWAHGTIVLIDSNEIGGLTSVSFPTEEKERVEITAHDSNGVREYVAGLRDSGTVDLAMRIRATDAGQQALWRNYGDTNNTPVELIIRVPGDPEVNESEFSLIMMGYVVSRGGSLPFDGPGEQTYSFQITGDVDHSLVSV